MIERQRSSLYYNCPIGEELQDFMDQNGHLLTMQIDELRHELYRMSKHYSFKIHINLLKWIRDDLKRFDPKADIMRLKKFKNIKTLSRGMCFGELALLNVQRRAARVNASADCIFGVLDKKEYDRVLGKKMHEEFRMKIEFLKHFRMFKKLTESRLQRVIYCMPIKKAYQRGQVVFQEGSSDINGIYLISSGEFEISAS